MKYTCLSVFLCCAVLLGGTADLSRYAEESFWVKRAEIPAITRSNLVQAIEMGRSYFLNHIRPEGNFIYSLDLATGDINTKDNQVRQAGALWCLSSLNRDRFNEPTRRALVLGMDFYASNLQELPTPGLKCPVYPGFKSIATGAVALQALAVMEFLIGQERYLDDKVKSRYRTLLEHQLAFLHHMELPDGSWAREYDLNTGFRDDTTSPYYDGECLLAYCKAARFLGYSGLCARIDHALPNLFEKYTVQRWKNCTEDEQTKGFCQWGCLAAAEYLEAGWKPAVQIAKDGALALAWWLVYDNQIALRVSNSGYAVEGLLGAWRVAVVAGDKQSAARLRQVILEIMPRLMTYQYKGPFMACNPTLAALHKAPPGADGGIVNGKGDTVVRIDVHQHQMHAMLLMLKHFFPNE